MSKLPRTVSKSVLKAKMLEIFRELESQQEELVVTDNNIPVLRIEPIRRRKRPAEVFPQVTVKYSEPVESPTLEEWPEV